MRSFTTKTHLTANNDPFIFEDDLNAAIEDIESKGGYIVDVKYGIAKSNMMAMFSALIVYTMPNK